MKRLVIFDLDGTLLHTIADLAQSTNYALAQLGYPTHPQEAYPLMVGNGIHKLLERALLANERTDENVRRMRKAFVPHYDVHNTERSTPYPGIRELLSELHRQGIRLAVASNKYQEATEKLVNHYFPAIPFQIVLGQREGVPAKPDPAIVYEILKHTQTTPEEALYIGDSGVDMQTALNSGVTACGVTWGFRPRAELESFHPHHMVERAAEILPLIRL